MQSLILLAFMLFLGGSGSIEDDFDNLPDYDVNSCFGLVAEGKAPTPWCSEIAAISERSNLPGNKYASKSLASLTALKLKYDSTYDEITLLEHRLGLLELALWRQQRRTAEVLTRNLYFEAELNSKRSLLQQIRLIALKASVGTLSDPEVVFGAAKNLERNFFDKDSSSYSLGSHLTAAANFAHYFILHDQREAGLNQLRLCNEEAISAIPAMLIAVCSFQILKSDLILPQIKKEVASIQLEAACNGKHDHLCDALSRDLAQFIQ